MKRLKALKARLRQTKTSTDPRPYKHRKLEHGRHIRLLQLESYSPNKASELRCHLKTFQLDSECPEYDALSYTWGPPLNTPECVASYGLDHHLTIMLDSGEKNIGFTTIGRNLYEALVQLWQLKTKQVSPDSTDQNEHNLAQWIWIDAICIDQQNEVEKSQQVAIMNEIYAKARIVIAWLGQDDGTFEHVAEFHVECANEMLAWVLQSDTQEERVPVSYERITGGILIRDIGIEIPEDIIRSVALFYYRRRYLMRLWVCQELALARSPFVLLGDRILPFRVFADCSLFIKYNRAFGEIFALSIKAHDQTSDSYVGSFANLRFLRELNFVREVPEEMFKTFYGWKGDDREVFCSTLLICLEQSHMNVCSDPRDRIFALLAIAKSNLSPDFKPVLVPDYTTSHEQLYLGTASILLTTLPFLTLLGVVNHKGGEAHVRKPSWVPTFGLEHSLKGTPISLFRMRTLPGRRRPFNASGKFGHPSGISTFTQSELTLVGMQIGLVRAVAATSDIIGRNRVILQTMTLDDLDGGSMENEIRSFKAWMAGSIAILRRQHHDQPLTSDQTLEQLSRALHSVAGVPGAPSEDEVQDWLTAFAEEEDPSATVAKYNREISRFLSDYTSACVGRSIFSTDDSMGLGPPAVQPDDQVWILVPGRVAYILRPTEDQGRYLFIGEAYLHGVMFGEAADSMSREELVDVTLI